MRILFTSFPAYGHIHPVVPLALAARKRGDDVFLATGADFADWIAACGLSPAIAGIEYEDLVADSHARFGGRMREGHLFTSVAVPPMLRDLLQLAANWPPHLIVHEESEYAAPLAAHLLGLPCITHSWSAPARPPNHREVLRGLLGPIWNEHTNADVQQSGAVYLDACPPMFQTEAIGSIPGVRPIQAVPFDGPPSPPPPWLDRMERPAAYVTFGTVGQFSRPEVIQSTVDAVSRVTATTVVTTGPNPADVIATHGASVIVEQYVPQSLVLPRVDVVVSHGGAGTTLGAIREGLPHVVVPQNGSSQLRNAQQVQALGIGKHVDDVRRGSLMSAVEAALNEPMYAKKAQQVREKVLSVPSPELVLARLAEELA